MVAIVAFTLTAYRGRISPRDQAIVSSAGEVILQARDSTGIPSRISPRSHFTRAKVSWKTVYYARKKIKPDCREKAASGWADY